MTALHLTYRRESISLPSGSSLTFGRDAALIVATDPAIAAIAGCFRQVGGFWWLANRSLSHRIELVDRVTSSVVTVPAGVEIAIAFTSAYVDLYVDGRRYRLSISLDLPAQTRRQTTEEVLNDPAVLNADQRLLLTALAETQLRTGTPAELPSNQELARRLGWSTSKLNRKLDHLAIKFSKRGVEGLRGSRAQMANDRRSLLVAHVLRLEFITVADLDLLDHVDEAKASGFSCD